jgi:tRNA(fMet)-specific endonuclease VapC
MYVLDTNSVVFFFKGEGRVGERLLARKPAEIAIPAIVLYELEVGVLREFRRVRGLQVEDWYS